MSLSKHPNVLRVRGSWMDGCKLYIALRLMNKGSAADVMRYGWPGGMEEEVVRCVLRQALEGLNYLHVNGFIHRDVKAANLLIDDDGTVLLGDLGVGADLSEDSSHNMSPWKGYTITLDQSKQTQPRPTIRKRKSFVGTPCWMAPELIAGRQYDCAADIWSFGITALELCQGRPPRSREPSKDVLLRILYDVAPTLNREGGVHRYSRAFKEMIDSCLEKDPSKRPTAAQLLQLPFFRGAKKKNYLINTILKDLPPLARRQERRTLRNKPTTTSVDSWDFTSTVQPPTTFGRHGAQLDYLPNSAQDPVEVSIGVFDFDDDEPSCPRKYEEQRPSTSSSSGCLSEHNSTGGSLSIPLTDDSSFFESPPSPFQIQRQDPHVQPSSLPQSEGSRSAKKRLWSRIASGVRKPSIPKGQLS
ncbi:Serine/threonine-protein kinase fray2 [Leucoagaricus sp. SymC.cos]|nr:Serine/threonine-protein kinase fray2 [Leucoagaricus sp. SymC.cos]